MTYSASRLETYRQCPQKFKFTYLDQVPSVLEGIEAFMGSRVHEALEKLYTDVRFCKPVSIAAILDDYRRTWDAKWHADVRIVRDGMAPDDYFAIGQKCLVDYDARYRPFTQTRTLGLEHPIRLRLDEAGEYRMQGFIDRLSQPRQGVIWIHDYKTKGFFPTQRELDEDRQLAYYQMAVQQAWPETEEVELVWHYLIYDYEFRSRRTKEELEALRQETVALIREIETATAFPPKESGLCTWCEYQNICPLFRHLYETVALAKSDYGKDAGVALVDRLAALQAEEEKKKGEIAQVKEALLRYAQEKGVETVFSKSYKARIRLYDNVRFPGRNDPGRVQLEQMVRESGKWDEVSSLDVFLLSKAVLGKGWSVELRDRIKKMGTMEKSPWIKVFPRDERK